MSTLSIPPYLKTVFISLLIIIIVFFMVMAKSILVPLMVSGYIAMVMTNFCDKLEKNKIPRSLSAFAAVSLFIVMIGGFLYFAVSQVKKLLTDMQTNMPAKINDFVIKLNTSVEDSIGYDPGMGNGFKMDKFLNLLESENTNTAEMFITALGTLSNVVLLPVFIFFLLIYRDHLAVFITKVFEKQRNKVLIEHIVSIRKIVYDYLLGAGKVMLILGIINTTVLLVLGIEHAIFFGMFAGFLNIIPYVGPFIGALLPFSIALVTKDSLFYPIAVIVAFTLVQFIESSYLTPKITGSNVNLNAFITFLGLLIGAAIWGIMGMILIIPTLAILKKLFELTPETEPYAYLFGEESSKWFQKQTLK